MHCRNSRRYSASFSLRSTCRESSIGGSTALDERMPISTSALMASVMESDESFAARRRAS